MYNSYYSNFNMKESDKNTLKLLNIQKLAVSMNISSDLLSYISTNESIQLVYNKYLDNPLSTPNPDIPALQSAYLSYLARIILAQIAFSRYNTLYEQSLTDEGINFSLTPNININIGNVFGIISYYYILQGTKGIYDRDLNNPIFGI